MSGYEIQISLSIFKSFETHDDQKDQVTSFGLKARKQNIEDNLI